MLGHAEEKSTLVSRNFLSALRIFTGFNAYDRVLLPNSSGVRLIQSTILRSQYEYASRRFSGSHSLTETPTTHNIHPFEIFSLQHILSPIRFPLYAFFFFLFCIFYTRKRGVLGGSVGSQTAQQNSWRKSMPRHCHEGQGQSRPIV